MSDPLSGPARLYVHPNYLDEAAHANIPDPAGTILDLCSIEDERGLVKTADILKPLFAEWAASPGAVMPYPVVDHHWQATLARTVLGAFGGSRVPEHAVFFGDGTYELFKEIAGYILRKGTLLGAGPVYPEFAGYFTAAGGAFRRINDDVGGFPAKEILAALATDRDISAVYADLPYNSTGGWPAEPEVLGVVEEARRRDVIVIIDEAYANFLGRDHSYVRHAADHENLVILRSLSKGYDLRGLRFGFVVAGAMTAPLFRQVRSPYSPSQPGAQAGLRVLRDAPDIVSPLIDAIGTAKKRVLAAAARCGLVTRPTHPTAPNMMFRAPTGGLAARLAAQRVRAATGRQFAFTTDGRLDDDVRLRVPLNEHRLAILERALDLAR